MTNERTNMDDRDAAVSRVYRRLSDETPSSGLDARILAEATRAARPRYVRPLRWMRPLAWAATIVLTVSVIVHMAELPSPADITPPESEQDAEFDGTDDARLDARQESGALPTPASEPAAARRIPQEPETSAPTAERRERAVEAGASTDTAAMKTAESIEEATRSLADTDMLRRASDLARQQESGSAAAPAAADMATFSATAIENPAGACTDEERGAPDRWFACIERLRAAGQEAAAAVEMAELSENFPDFTVP